MSKSRMLHSTLRVFFSIAALLLPVDEVSAQTGAKVLFHDPMCGQPSAYAPLPTSTARRFPPVQSTTCRFDNWPRFRFPGIDYYPRFIGIHYWFENEQGERFADIRKAGAKPRLHVRSNIHGYLTVWKADADAHGSELTPRNGPYSGYLLPTDHEYIVPDDLAAFQTGTTRLLFWFSRSQTEQVESPSEARQRIEHRLSEIASDGGPAQVRESDSATPGEIGNYVVNRQGDQVGEEIVIAP
jgi:hypothetical protein